MDDYGYLNARVRSMNRDLFKREYFLELLNQPELDNMVEALQGTLPYGEDISAALAESSGLSAIEKALRHNLSRTFGKILYMSSGEPKSLTSILLNKWDVFNIKTILRGKKAGRPNEEIVAAFIPVGVLDEPKLTELANQPDAKSVVDMLVTWGFHLSHIIAKAFHEFMEKGDILGMERAIDEFYFEWALMETEDTSENNQIVRNLIIEQIDFANIHNTLKLLNEKVSAGAGVKPQSQSATGRLRETRPIPGGKFKYKFLLSLSKCATVEEALGLLVNTKLSSAMEKAISAYVKTHKLSAVERFLEAFMAEEWSSTYKKDPLSIAIIIGFLGRKLNEFMNLRIIARGKAHVVPVDIMKGELVFV
jgi:V/A-type H+-transporting ATPase subunit C